MLLGKFGVAWKVTLAHVRAFLRVIVTILDPIEDCEPQRP